MPIYRDLAFATLGFVIGPLLIFDIRQNHFLWDPAADDLKREVKMSA